MVDDEARTNMILFRPVGIEELRLIHASGMHAFPPRLPDQPIFYPVLNVGYARQIARDWNTKSGSKVGFVTQFEVGDDYVGRFERHIVGGRHHEELWVPADQLDNMVPTALSKGGDVRLVFSGTEGALEVVGVGVRIGVTGEAVFVENFPGS